MSSTYFDNADRAIVKKHKSMNKRIRTRKEDEHSANVVGQNGISANGGVKKPLINDIDEMTKDQPADDVKEPTKVKKKKKKRKRKNSKVKRPVNTSFSSSYGVSLSIITGVVFILIFSILSISAVYTLNNKLCHEEVEQHHSSRAPLLSFCSGSSKIISQVGNVLPNTAVSEYHRPLRARVLSFCSGSSNIILQIGNAIPNALTKLKTKYDDSQLAQLSIDSKNAPSLETELNSTRSVALVKKKNLIANIFKPPNFLKKFLGVLKKILFPFKRKKGRKGQKIIADTLKQQLIVSVRENLYSRYGGKKSIQKRAALVPWGGEAEFSFSDDRIFYSYLKITNWPQDLITTFPFNQPCSKGCPVDFAIYHTLKYRETFKPWLISQNMIEEGRDGWSYTRGLTLEGDPIVWYKMGKHTVVDNDSYIRVLLHSFERAIAKGLKSSSGENSGKYTVFIDLEGFSTSKFPSFQYVKKLFTVMQDHFPNRLNKVALLNLSTSAHIFYNLCKPLLQEAVKKKISVPSQNKDLRLVELKKLVPIEHIPTWLGGLDEFSFDSDKYYGKSTAKSQQLISILAL